MIRSQDPQPRQRRDSARYQARLDAETQAKLEELAKTFHRKRAPILRYVMQWGLSHSRDWTVDEPIPMSTHLVPVLLNPTLRQPVQDAAAAHGASVAAWVRQAMRQVTYEDFPASGRAGETAPRSHESGYDHRRFQLRLDEASGQKLETLRQRFHCSAAAVMRQLIAQARPEDFPMSWQTTVTDRRRHQHEGEAR